MTTEAIALATVRALHDIGVLSTFGVLIARAAGIAGPSLAWRRLLRRSLLVALIAAPAWLVLQAAEMAGAATAREALAAAPVALFDTEFGHALLGRMALLCVSALPLWMGSRYGVLFAAGAAGFACAAQVRMGHAAAPDGSWQAPAAALHMLAAGAWIGGLLPLACGLGETPVRSARRFSILGLVCVTILAASAVLQALPLVGGLPGLIGSEYGHTVLIKTGLFFVLLGVAALNRFRLSPPLAGLQPARAVARLRRSIYVEALIGGATVFAAAWLAALPPGAHEQPVWPLRWQPSWDAFDDPGVMTPLRAACLLLAAALLTLLAAKWSQRARPGVGVAAVAAVLVASWLALPQLHAFIAPAYPSSFYESPTGFTKASVAQGAGVYRRECASCHGSRGFGDGAQAASLAIRPAPLTGFHLLERSDGEMFWLISNGIPSTVMSGFDTALSDDDRWAVIDYVRTLAGAEPSDTPAPTHHHH